MPLEKLPIVDIAKIVIPGTIAFITGRYFSQKANRLIAFRESFFGVYKQLLPLIQPHMYKDAENESELLITLELMDKILKKNNHLVFDNLDDAMSDLIHKIKNGLEYDRLFDQVCLSIERSSYKLKRSLGYPTPKRYYHLVKNVSLRRFKAMLKRADLFLSELLIAPAFLVLLILATSLLYDFFAMIGNWIVMLYSR